jgi:G3E family GTPase
LAFLTSARQTIPNKSEALPDWLGNSPHEHGHGHRHDGDIRSLSAVLDEPTSWAGYACWVNTLRQLPSTSILRVKGVLNLREAEKPVVIHGVQHTFYRPSFLDRWPNTGRKSQIVLITWKLDPIVVQRSLEAFKVTPGSETRLDLDNLY